VFSLGVMTFEMLTGRLPYGAGSFIDIGMKQAGGQVDTTGLSPAMADAIGRAIAYERAQRPESPLSFAQDLRGAAGSG